MTEKLHLPREAVLDGAETMYPEFRKKMKDAYVQPEPCKRNCLGNQGGGGARAIGAHRRHPGFSKQAKNRRGDLQIQIAVSNRRNHRETR